MKISISKEALDNIHLPLFMNNTQKLNLFDYSVVGIYRKISINYTHNNTIAHYDYVDSLSITIMNHWYENYAGDDGKEIEIELSKKIFELLGNESTTDLGVELFHKEIIKKLEDEDIHRRGDN